MLRTKKDVDRHVQDIFRKLPDENEVRLELMWSVAGTRGLSAAGQTPLANGRAVRILTAQGVARSARSRPPNDTRELGKTRPSDM